MQVRTLRSEPEARIPAYVLRSQEFAALCAKGGITVHVLLVLWAHGRQDQAWCTQRRIANLTGAWRASVQDAIRTLEEQGWIRRSERRSRDNRRIADNYDLLLPGPLEACRGEINQALAGGSGTDGIQSPLWRKGDVFAFKEGLYVREARVPLSVLQSEAFGALRERGISLHLWLLLLSAGQYGAAWGKRGLAKDLHVAPSRVTEALAYLRGEDPRGKPREGSTRVQAAGSGIVWLETERATSGNTADRHVVRLVPRLTGQAVAPKARPEASTLDRTVLPPPELVEQLPEIMRGIVQEWAQGGCGDGEIRAAWNWLENERIVPPPPPVDPWAGFSPSQAADWLVRAFHRSVRGAVHYDPTLTEIRLARRLVNERGTAAIGLVESAVAQMRATSFRAGNFAAVMRYVTAVP